VLPYPWTAIDPLVIALPLSLLAILVLQVKSGRKKEAGSPE